MADRALIALHYALASSPCWAAVVLICVSGRTFWLLGHWPDPNLDDPLAALPHDQITTLLRILMEGTLSAAILSIGLIPISVIVVPKIIPIRHQIRVFALFVACWMLFLLFSRLFN